MERRLEEESQRTSDRAHCGNLCSRKSRSKGNGDLKAGLRSATEMTAVPTGRYRHYKGKEYTVLGVARHSETEEEFVVYRQEYGDHGLWVRPATMFLEAVESGGGVVPRFELVGE
jgi:hypothetical protein